MTFRDFENYVIVNLKSDSFPCVQYGDLCVEFLGVIATHL
jgi:hypothetical protein